MIVRSLLRSLEHTPERERALHRTVYGKVSDLLLGSIVAYHRKSAESWDRRE